MDRGDKPFAAGMVSMLIWIAIITASLALLVGGQLEEYAVFGVVAVAIGGANFIYRLNSFRKKSPELLSTGQSLKPFDYRSQTRQGSYLLIAILVFFLLPLLLAGLLDTSSWLGTVAGGFDGWLLSLLAFNYYLHRWERAHGGRLYSSKVWRGTKVAQTGLRFDRFGEST